MKLIFAFVAAITLSRCFAQDEQRVCTPVPFTAIGFDPITFVRYRFSSDISRGLSLFEDAVSDDWILADSGNNTLYTFMTGGCTYVVRDPTLEATQQSMQTSIDHLYDYDTVDGRHYKAFEFDIPGGKYFSLYSKACVATVSTTTVNNQVMAINLFLNVNTDNPDFSSLEKKLAIARDPILCAQA
ncbi:hypothetical protein PoB_005632200 [Plakobranchus ocellatus]|uniref:Uncharacterized protein n=1 Tax=Plakobranchus ocellatus TaxID=259542 RepID=A0AAV4CE60_9GAST|nr:hypothetical protein PoB_005632200 [Plakobranchus ocellatus]